MWATILLLWSRKENFFNIKTNNGEFVCESVIVATGLYSGGNKLGSNGGMFKILKNAGYKTIKTTPAIVQLKTETDIVKQLKGIKVDALATLKHNGKSVKGLRNCHHSQYHSP